MWNFIKKWSDVLIFLPSAFLLFVFNDKWIRYLDPTAASMSVEHLVVLNFNIFIAASIFSIAYFIYNLFFHDYFDKFWEEKLADHPVACAVTHLILWLSTVIGIGFLLLRGL